MPTYTVSRLIKSAMRLWDPYEIDGITFRPLDFPPSDDLVVSEEIDAARFRDASRLFDEHLLPVIDAVTVVTGSAQTPLGGGTLIEKKRGRYAYLRAIRRRPSARLSVREGFNTDMLDEAARVAQLFRNDRHRRSASYYLRQAALAENVIALTFHLLQVVDVLATLPGTTRTDKDLRRKLLGEDQHDFFYAIDPVRGESRRNALAHGRLIDEVGLIKRNTDLASHLVGLVRNALKATSDRSLTPIRGFVTYEPRGLFLRPIGPLPALRDLIRMAHAGDLHSASDPQWVGAETSKHLSRVW